MDVYDSEIQAIKRIIDVCVGIPRFTYQMQQKDAPRPVGEYAAVKCVSSVNPGCDESKVVDVGGVEMYRSRGIRILTFQILFSREGSEFIKFDNSFYRPDVQAVLKKEKFAAMDKKPLNLASLTLETNWEFRQAVQMQFNVLREELSPIGVMSGAVVGGVFIDGDQVIQVEGK